MTKDNNKKINLGKQLKNFDGENLGITVGQALSKIIVQEKGDPLRYFTMGQKFFNDKSIEIEPADLEILKKAVGSNEVYNALVNGQILLELQ